MEKNLNKLQIRAKTMSILSELKTDKELSHDKFKEYIEALNEITDKEDLFDILAKELNKTQEPYITAIKAILIETIPLDILKDKILDILTSKKVTDQGKYQLIQLLKDTGATVDYEKFFNYFENPESIIDYDTEKLLEFATVNPETQIDFLDFLTSLPNSDKLMLINSLNEDYEGENLANILAPILYSNIDSEILKRTVEILGASKSSLAIEPINYVMNQTEDLAIVSLCKKNLSMLKLAGTSEKKAEIFYKMMLSETKIHKCYTTIPDGHDNQGIIVSRINKEGYFQMFAVVINGLSGIIDCFGFNSIGIAELDRIISRFYKNERKIEVTPQYCKSLINKAINLTQIFKEGFPYEFICWNALTKDVNELDASIEELVKQNLEVISLNKSLLQKFYQNDYVDKWFFSTSDNQAFEELINILKQNESLDLKLIETKISEFFDKIWDKQTIQQLDNRIINTAYLINELGEKDNAQILYSLLFNQDFKNELMLNISKKSVYEYFLVLKQNIKEFSLSTNIFRAKKDNTDKTMNSNKVNEIIKNIESNWVDNG